MPDKKNAKNNLSISLIICTRNRVQDLRDCFDSVIHQTHSVDEIIIVDSSDNLLTRELSEDYKTRTDISLKYIHTSPGLTKQRNIGIRMAHGDIVTFLDDDVILESNYFKEIINAFCSSTNIVAVGGNITNSSTLRGSKKLFFTMFLLERENDEKGYIQKSGFVNNLAYNTITKMTETKTLSGCNYSFRKEILDDHLFDEFFDGYGLSEDVEFSYRVSKGKGNKMVITPFAKLIHKESPVARTGLKKLFEMRIVNHYYVFVKHVKMKKSDWIYFWWSNIGVIFLAIFWSLKIRKLTPISGILSGHKRIINLSD
ncbi:MAG: glycosyltransferase [Proteobacteria bacterium]|nr:glycosyltransferase [Pseudomonadota bacterium]